MKKLLMLLSAAVLAAGSLCSAQLNTASISGQVTDAQGADVPGAIVQVTERSTGVVHPGKSNGTGFYSVQNLPIGDFTVTVSAPGFEKYVHPGIVLTTAQSLELDVKLEIGQLSQTVEVTGAAPLVETRTSDFTQFIESKTVSDVPLGNRKTMNVVQTIGAAVFLNDNPGGSQPTYSLAGGRVQSQMTFLDGGLTQNFRLGAGQQSIDPPIDAIREIQVIASTYPAQYGASNGGIVIESSKSGGNRVHASAYEFLRNEDADAPGYFAAFKNGVSGPKIRPENRYNIYGGTIGGPIWRDRTFFFFSTEIFRWNEGVTTTLNVPSQQERTGNFSQLLGAPLTGNPIDPCDGSVIRAGQIYNPATQQTIGGVTCRSAFAGNIIPSGSQDPVAAKIMSYYPVPNGSPTNTTLTGTYNTMTNTDFYLIKIDHELTHRDHVTARYMYYQNNIQDTSLYPDRGADPVTRPDGSTTMVYGSETHTFSATKVNNFGFSYYRRTGTQFGYAYGENWPQKLGLTGVPEVSFPAISVAGLSGLGQASQGAGSILTQEQYLDDYSWLIGRHALKMGGEFRGSRGDGIEQTATSSGTFTFAGQTTSVGTGIAGVSNSTTVTGSPIASLLAGGPSGFSISNGVPVDRRTQYLAFYLQDDWTATPRLTLNYGLRWETDFPETDARNRLNGFDPTEINPVSGTPGVVKFAGINYPNSAWNGNWTNFSPRLGFAYKPFNNERTAIRGGWGIYFGPPIDNTSWGGANLGYVSQATVSSPNSIDTPIFYLAAGVPPYTLQSPALNDSYGAVAAPYTNASTAVSYFPRHRPTERSYEFNLNIEHQFTQTMVVTLTGLGNLGRSLTANNQQTDQISPSNMAMLQNEYPNGPPASLSLQQFRPYPQFNGVTLIAPVIGTTNYLGAVIRVEKRYSHGYNFVSTFTKSKQLGDVNDNANASAGNLGNDNGIFSNYYNRAADYGPTENDIENRFTFNAVYELPFGAGKPMVNHGAAAVIFGGFELSTLTVVQSGAPMTTVTTTNNTEAYSSGLQRPNQNGNPNLSRSKRHYHYSGDGTSTWFNTAVFSQPSIYNFGNEKNGVIRAPGFTDVDFSLLKRVALPGKSTLEIRLDAFNAFNITEPGLPNLTYGSATFGQITGPNNVVNQNRRTMELGAHYSF